MYADSRDDTKITETVRKKGKQTNKQKRFCYLPTMPINARDSAGTSRDKQGQGRDQQGQAGTSRDTPSLYLLVPVCPCLSLLVLVCPCLTFSVPVRFYICYTFISTPADEYDILCQYVHRYIDFPCKNHCCNACKTCLQLLLYFSSSITLLFNFYSWDKYHKGLHLKWLHSHVFLWTLKYDDLSYLLLVFWRRYLMLKGLLCGLWTSDYPSWLECHHRFQCLSFLFEHDKGSSEIGLSLDFSVIIVS